MRIEIDDLNVYITPMDIFRALIFSALIAISGCYLYSVIYGDAINIAKTINFLLGVFTGFIFATMMIKEFRAIIVKIPLAGLWCAEMNRAAQNTVDNPDLPTVSSVTINFKATTNEE